MRRPALFLAATLALFGAVLPAAQAQSGGSAQPPHAYLFGTWTGGLFPVPANLSPQACLSQPVVIFTRDLVMRATLTEQTLIQREIETARVRWALGARTRTRCMCSAGARTRSPFRAAQTFPIRWCDARPGRVRPGRASLAALPSAGLPTQPGLGG